MSDEPATDQPYRPVCTHVHAPRCRPAAGAGPSPVDQQAPRDRQQTGHPLTVLLASGNRHDVTQLIGLSNAIPRVCGFRGRPRHRPGRLFADRDYDKYRRILRSRSITRKIARKDTSHGSGLGRNRWVFERTFTWLHQCGRAFFASRQGAVLWCALQPACEVPARARRAGCIGSPLPPSAWGRLDGSWATPTHGRRTRPAAVS